MNTLYRMPAEWEPHEATWLSWPHNEETWPGIDLEKIQALWAWMAALLSEGEAVHINVGGRAMEEQARALLNQHVSDFGKIFFHHFPTDDAWIRDHGPIFVWGSDRDHTHRILLNWEYNAWGGKYPPFDQDNAIPSQIAAYLREELVSPGWILEGGSVEVNGRGTLLTTESCLLNPNRNPRLDRPAIEQLLSRYLGVSNCLWLGEGIVGDDTDGHVDDLTRFVHPDTLVTVFEEDPSDENFLALKENLKRLKAMKDEGGRPFRILTLPMPAPVISDIGRLPASYANFYIANKVVLVPVFEDSNDDRALEILRPLFPGRKVVGLVCRDLVKGLGAIHCVTQQVPLRV